MPVLVALFLSAIVLFFDGHVAYSAYKQHEAASYQTVTGTITHSIVSARRGSKGGTTYSADIGYSYQVGEQKYFGQKVRFGFNMDDRSHAYQIVHSHPPGSEATVYYNTMNPDEAILEPGFDGSDLMIVLILTPFNALMIWLCGRAIDWLRARKFHPIAGGAKLIFDDLTIRARLPRYGPLVWGLVATGGLGLISFFVLEGFIGMHPSWTVGTSVIAGVYAAGVIAYFWQWRVVSSGADDLVINKYTRTLSLPTTFGRKNPITVDISDIQSIWVETIEHRGSRGGATYSYAPTLRLLRSNHSDQKLADWRDSLRADNFAQWLGKEIGVAVELSDRSSPTIAPKSGTDIAK